LRQAIYNKFVLNGCGLDKKREKRKKGKRLVQMYVLEKRFQDKSTNFLYPFSLTLSSPAVKTQ
jgi:hypothetical protein